MDFTTILKDFNVSCHGLSAFLNLKEVQSESLTATIKWSAEVEERDYGIRGITSVIHSVNITGNYEYYEDDDVECLELLEADLPDISHFTINDKMVMDKDSLYPNEVEIDFGTKTITVS